MATLRRAALRAGGNRAHGLGIADWLSSCGMSPWRLVASAAIILVALGVVGFPVWNLVGRRRHLPAPVFCPLLGLGVVQIASSAWLSMSNRSLRGFVWVLLTTAAATLVWLVAARRDRPRRPAPRLAALGLVISLVGAGGMFIVHYWPVLARSSYTQPDTGSADVASYSMVADHLLEHGTYALGPIVNHDLGNQARTDTPGSTIFVAFAADLLRVDTWKATLPVLFVAYVLGAATLYTALSKVVRRHHLLLAFVAVSSVATYLVIYSVEQFFLSQFVAMSAVPAAMLILVRSSAVVSKSEYLRLILALAVISGLSILTYPHMLFLGLPALAAASLGGVFVAAMPAQVGTLLRRAIALIASAAFGLLGGYIMTYNRAGEALERVRALGVVQAGWPLPKITPLELVGFQRTFTQITGTGTKVGSIVLIALCAMAVAVILRRGDRTFAIPAVASAALYASYVFVYRREGISYTQWKWLAYFTPMIVAGMLCAIVGAFDALIADRSAIVFRRASRFAVVRLLALIAVQTATPAPSASGSTTMSAFRMTSLTLLRQSHSESSTQSTCT